MRIKEIVIHFQINTRRPHILYFRDHHDVLCGSSGRRFVGISEASAARLQKVIFDNRLPVDIDFAGGVISVLGEKMICANCGKTITTMRYNIDGKDFCSTCQRDVPRRPDPHIEHVTGMVFGRITAPYEFHCAGGAIKRGYFGSDEEALEWFKQTYPVLYTNGAEMRVFDI